MDNLKLIDTIEFPAYTGTRCLMMPYVQGDPDSLPPGYSQYREIVSRLAIERGEVGYLTIDESPVEAGKAHRGQRATTSRAIHTEAGRLRKLLGWGAPGFGWGAPQRQFGWGAPSYGWGVPPKEDEFGWGKAHRVTLDPDTQVLLANNIDNTCALWDARHEDTTEDGDIGHAADQYPYHSAVMMRAGEVYQIGILTPHESLPVAKSRYRKFLRIVGQGVHGREEYFTENPMMARPAK